jgi:hypothetical protein
LTTARQFLEAIRQYQALTVTKSDVDALLRELPDEQFRTLVLVSAEVLKQLKDEAIRRGIWEDFKGRKVTG